jgi:hypothetical protein
MTATDAVSVVVLFGAVVGVDILLVPWAFDRGAKATVVSAAVRTRKVRFMVVISFMVFVVA